LYKLNLIIDADISKPSCYSLALNVNHTPYMTMTLLLNCTHTHGTNIEEQ